MHLCCELGPQSRLNVMLMSTRMRNDQQQVFPAFIKICLLPTFFYIDITYLTWPRIVNHRQMTNFLIYTNR